MCVFFQYSADSEPRDSRYAMSHTSELDTSITKTSSDIGSSEPKSQEKATVRFMYRHCMYRTLCTVHYVQYTMYRTLCMYTMYRHYVQALCTDTVCKTLCTGQYVQDSMYEHYVPDTMYRTLYADTMYRHYVQTLCTDTMCRHYVWTLCTGTMYRTLCTDTMYRTLCT